MSAAGDQEPDCPLRTTRAVVDLKALRDNLARLQAAMPWAQLLPAVKANAYGHGLVRVARVCSSFGVAGVCVATLAEAVELRRANFSAKILLLEDLFVDEIEVALAYHLCLTISSLEYARRISAVAGKIGTTALVHIMIDTGMGRLGLPYHRGYEDFILIRQLPNFYIDGIFSHFAAADERDPGSSQRQIKRMDELCAQLLAQGVRLPARHMANSAALLRYGSLLAADRLARPGLAIYGLQPSDAVHISGLRPVLSLVSRLLKVTTYERPWPIGYGSTWQAHAGSCIGVVPIGYGDGYSRVLSNRAAVLVRGQRVPVVGRVSMDMITVDLSRLAGEAEPLVEGEEVVLIGRQSYFLRDGGQRCGQVSTEELARLSGTIAYEIVCGISARVPRVYVGES